MMNKANTILAIVLLCASSVASAQIKIFKGASDKNNYGIQYVLPKTTVNVQIVEKRTSYRPGELCQYAERFLKLSDVPTEASVHWNFVSAELSMSARPDSAKVYFIPMNEKTIAPLMERTPDGIIKSINMPVEATSATVQPLSKNSIVNEEKLLDPHSLLTEEILMAGSTAKMAELVAKEIYNIRDSRSELVRGQADNLPKDGAQLKLMLDNLDKQEKSLMSMFTGTYSYEEKTVTLPIDIVETKGVVLFRFSDSFGVVSKDDLSGRPFYMVLEKQKGQDLLLNIPKDDKKAKEEENEGVAYNIPGRAQITILDGNKQVVQANYPATQFGSVEYLAPTLFNKKSTVSVKFDPMTGALLKIDRKNIDN